MATKKTALIVVDLQNDFVAGGALAVPEGETLPPLVNRILPKFHLVAATQDWHPRGHGSFAANHDGAEVGDVVDLHGLEQILWPVHCVQGTKGAEFLADFDLARVDRVFRKGTDPAIDSYSGFFDNARRKDTGLGDYLREREVGRVYIAGLATDYCVKYTALDAVRSGFETVVLADLCRGVDLHPGDVDRAFAEMREAGVRVSRG